jgi:hypothetical protein
MLPRRRTPAFALIVVIGVLLDVGVHTTAWTKPRTPDLDFRSFNPPVVVES